MKSAGKARSNGLYRHIRTSKEIIRNLLNDYTKYKKTASEKQLPLKKTLIFLFLNFLRGIATAVFIRKHNK